LAGLLGAEPEALMPPPGAAGRDRDARSNHRALIDVAGRRAGRRAAAVRARRRLHPCGLPRRARRAAHLARRQPQDRGGPGGEVPDSDRRGVAQDPPQQHDRLSHRGDGDSRRQARSREARFHAAAVDVQCHALLDRRAGRPRDPHRPRRRFGIGAGAVDLRGAGRRGDGGFDRRRFRRPCAGCTRRRCGAGGTRGQRELRAACAER
jgi:hypothetical protein